MCLLLLVNRGRGLDEIAVGTKRIVGPRPRPDLCNHDLKVLDSGNGADTANTNIVVLLRSLASDAGLIAPTPV